MVGIERTTESTESRDREDLLKGTGNRVFYRAEDGNIAITGFWFRESDLNGYGWKLHLSFRTPRLIDTLITQQCFPLETREAAKAECERYALALLSALGLEVNRD